MNQKTKRILMVTGAVLALAWASLFLSGRAVLVWGSGPGSDAQIGALRCSYFTGTGFTERKFLYAEGGILGREACPRWIDLQD